MAHRPSGKLMAVKRVRIINRAAGDGGGDHESEMNKKRLDAELNAIRRSSECPQIVKFYGTIDDEGSRLVCMELMDISLENVYRTVYSILEEKFPEDLIG
jgi:serine/threonine protein kinase